MPIQLRDYIIYRFDKNLIPLETHEKYEDAVEHLVALQHLEPEHIFVIGIDDEGNSKKSTTMGN